ncbi:MAG: hypothetical protein R3E39_18860 [Anaerolineae bacterium]
MHIAPIPDDHRGAYRRNDSQRGPKFAVPVADIIAALRQNRGADWQVILPSRCPAWAGQIVLPPDYLTEVYRHVRAAGGLCIADEVQVGFGRLGTHFWGFDMQQ